MSELFKSKLGMLLAGILLLTVFSCLMYFYLIDRGSVLPHLLSMLLSSPWYVFLFYILIPMVMGGVGEVGWIVAIAIGALINAFILYWLGFLLAKAFTYLSSRNPKP
jgi:hypothetical protein